VHGTFGTAALVALVAAARGGQGEPETGGVEDVLDPDGVGVGRGNAADGPGLADGVVVGRGTLDVGVAVADDGGEPKPGGGWMLTLRPKWLRVSRRK
jgi:hypothetical protein